MKKNGKQVTAKKKKKKKRKKKKKKKCRLYGRLTIPDAYRFCKYVYL